MKKLLLVLTAVVALAVPSAALADPVQTPVGILNLDVSNGSLSASTFQFGGNTVPVDPQLEAANTDNVNVWVGGPDTPTDYVSQYPGYVRYQQFECARMILTIPDSPVTPDTGWHCAAFDNPFTVDSVTATSASNPANATVSFDGNGLTDREPFPSGDPILSPDLSPYAGLVLQGFVYSNVCSQIYLNVDYYTPGGDSGVNNMTGCIGSADPFTVTTAARQTASASTTGKIEKPTGPATAISARIPGGCVVPRHLAGRTVASAKRALVKNNCRLGKITRKHSRVKKGRVIKPRMQAGSIHRVNTRVPLFVSRGR